MTHDHLTDDQLSAHLDGEGEAGPDASVGAHALEAQIATCGTCRERLAALSGARALLRVPVVPVSPSVRAAAVEAALSDAYGPDGAADPGPGPAPAVAVLTSRRRPRQSRVLVGAAAAVAVLAAAVAIPLGLSQGGPSSAPSAIATTVPVPHSSAQRAATPSQPAPGLYGTAAGGLRNLGTVTSVRDLRSRLAPVVASLGTDKDAASGALSAAGAPVTTVAGSGTFTVNGSVPVAFVPCVTVAQRAAGPAMTLELVATVTYGHTPALVVVVHPTAASSTPGSNGLAVVVARSGCRVLARATL